MKLGAFCICFLFMRQDTQRVFDLLFFSELVSTYFFQLTEIKKSFKGGYIEGIDGKTYTV